MIDKSASILLVEDDPNQLFLYQEILTTFGYSVATAGTVTQAQTLLDSQSYRLVITDTQLGKDNSIHFIARNRQRFNAEGTTIIALSADGYYQSAWQDQGVDFFIAKPLRAADLVKLVSRLLTTTALAS